MTNPHGSPQHNRCFSTEPNHGCDFHAWSGDVQYSISVRLSSAGRATKAETSRTLQTTWRTSPAAASTPRPTIRLQLLQHHIWRATGKIKYNIVILSSSWHHVSLRKAHPRAICHPPSTTTVSGNQEDCHHPRQHHTLHWSGISSILASSPSTRPSVRLLVCRHDSIMLVPASRPIAHLQSVLGLILRLPPISGQHRLLSCALDHLL